jgi:hypothetical protein
LAAAEKARDARRSKTPAPGYYEVHTKRPNPPGKELPWPAAGIFLPASVELHRVTM